MWWRDDDPVVRQAAVKALGRYNGAVVAIDPTNGRILSIVNQKLAFSTGFKPCSTIKPVIAVAALQEGIVTRDTLKSLPPQVIEPERSPRAFEQRLFRRTWPPHGL